MGWICEHCSAPFEGSAYWVKSEESGVLLLNIVVCHSCAEEAEKLGLHTEELSAQSYLEAVRPKGTVSR
jgi:ribosome-binding protein aMBF1 (putative translation factor)